MNKKIFALSLLVALGVVTDFGVTRVQAQTPAVPKLMGNYILTVNIICQATPSFPAGAVATRFLTVGYNSDTGMARIEGTQVQGYLIVPSGKKAGFTSLPVSTTSPFSNTATTLTASGVTWKIQYGKVDEHGIAQSYQTTGLYYLTDTIPCTGTTVALRQ